MRGDQHDQKRNFACDITRRSQSGELFLFENRSLAGNFAGRVVRSHQCQQDDLKHYQAGDKARYSRGSKRKSRCLEQLLQCIRRNGGKILDLRQTPPGKNHNQTRETEEERKLQSDLAAIAKEHRPAAVEQCDELGQKIGAAKLLRRASVICWRISTALIVEGGVLCPQVRPFVRASRAQNRKEILRIIDLKIVVQQTRDSLINKSPLVKDRDGVVQIEMPQAVGDGDNGPSVDIRDPVQQMHDFAFRLGVESARDFVAQEQQRFAHHLQCKGKASFLPARKNSNPAVSYFGESNFRQKTCRSPGPLVLAQSAEA